jgi:polyisoprenoid-binding protein YceI
MQHAARMTLSNGSFSLGPQVGHVRLHTGRAGAAAKAGHDLVIEAKQWSGTAVVDADNPSASSVSVDIVASSLEVVSGSGGAKALTDGDIAKIKKNINEEILNTGKNPTISFRSTKVEGTPDAFTITGDLTIMGKSNPIVLSGKSAGGKVTGTGTLVQTAYGIKPFSALMGALKVADEVGVSFEISL